MKITTVLLPLPLPPPKSFTQAIGVMVKGVGSHGVPATTLIHAPVPTDQKAVANVGPTCNKNTL